MINHTGQRLSKPSFLGLFNTGIAILFKDNWNLLIKLNIILPSRNEFVSFYFTLLRTKWGRKFKNSLLQIYWFILKKYFIDSVVGLIK